MCGIVGYVGPREVLPVLVGGLEKLEYRGYDSAGVAVIDGDKFQVFRTEGKLSNLKHLLEKRGKYPASVEVVHANGVRVGIGHTRWATHGRPSETNAHPHVAGQVCVVHNGIIENYLQLRERLEKQGAQFLSETDTEIAAHLINSHLPKEKSLVGAVRAATKELQGSYALVVVSLDDPECLVVARNATPIIVGLGEKEKFVASDIPAILEYTRDILIVEDDEIAEIRVNQIAIEHAGKKVAREPTHITWDPITAEKGGFRHFMLKEIHEQPLVVTETFRGRIDQQQKSVLLSDIELSEEEIKLIKRVDIVACGTAWHAALVAKFYLERFARLPVSVDYASEYRYREPLFDSGSLVMAISQSGETADTLGALKLAVQNKVKTVAICNVVGSSIARVAEKVLYTHAGPEISVASTKAFTTQLVAAYMLALRLGSVRKTVTPEDQRALIAELMHLPAALTQALEVNDKIEQVSKQYGKRANFLFLGRGFLYPVALEGALKLKEISYVHAEGYPAGEMKHGPIALIDEQTPVVAVLGHDGINYDKTISNLKEVEARGGKVIAVTDYPTTELTNLATEIIAVGGENRRELRMTLPMVLTVPLQLLAYHVAVSRGTDVDQPRNLAKSVTVE